MSFTWNEALCMMINLIFVWWYFHHMGLVVLGWGRQPQTILNGWALRGLEPWWLWLMVGSVHFPNHTTGITPWSYLLTTLLLGWFMMDQACLRWAPWLEKQMEFNKVWAAHRRAGLTTIKEIDRD